MSYSDGVISAPVSISDVHDVLGETSYDLGTLCISEEINWFAKYKPTRRTSVGIDEDAWQGLDGNCGLKPGTATSLSALAALYSEDNNGWTYLRPDGTNYPYRLLDFDGYNHNAQCPISSFALAASTIAAAASMSLDAYFNTASVQDGQLGFEDFSTIADGYIGVYCVKSSGSVTRWITLENPVSDAEGVQEAVSIVGTQFSSGSWTVYPFIAASAMTVNESITNTYYSIPNVSPLALTVVSSSVTLNINSIVATSTRVYTITYTVYALTSTTFSNCYAWIRHYESGISDALLSTETQTSIDSFTVSAGSTVTKTISVTRNSSLAESDAVFWITLNSAAYTASAMIE